MGNEIEEMITKFDEGIKKVEDLNEKSKPEIVENAEDTIQNLTSERLQLKMRIDHLQDDLEEFKKEDDYLSKDEAHRKSAEKVFTDRLDELKAEEKEAIEKLNNAKISIAKQKRLETRIEKEKKAVKDMGTAANISNVKEAILNIDSQILDARRNSISSMNLLNQEIMKQEDTIEKIKIEKRKLLDAPSWNQDKCDEYDKKIEISEEKLNKLKSKLEKQKEVELKSLLDLEEKKKKYKEFLEKLEYIFYGKDIFNKSIEEKTEPEKTEPEKTEPENTEPKNTEPEKTEPEKAESENTEPEKTEPEKAESENTEPAKAESEKTEPAKAESEKTEPEEFNPQSMDELKRELTTDVYPTFDKTRIEISAKDRTIMVFVGDRKLKLDENLGIESSFFNKKEIYKNIEINKIIDKVSESKNPVSKLVNRISMKRKLDPIVVNVLSRQISKQDKNGTEINSTIGKEIGMRVEDYIEAIYNDEELPVNLKYDLRESTLPEELNNKMYKVGRQANKVKGVEVLGLKPKKDNFFTRLLKTQTPEQLTEAAKFTREQDEMVKNEFKNSIKYDVTSQTTMENSEEKEEKEDQQTVEYRKGEDQEL